LWLIGGMEPKTPNAKNQGASKKPQPAPNYNCRFTARRKGCGVRPVHIACTWRTLE